MSTPAASLQPNLDAISADQVRLRQEAGAGLASVTATETGIPEAKKRDLAPLEQQQDALFKETTAMQPPGAAKLPEAPNKPLVDPKEYETLSWGLIGMALISGVASRGNWYGASASLNGALKGYLEGNQARAENDWKKYQADFDKALEQHKEQQQSYQDTLNNKKLTLNQIATEISRKAAQYDDQYMRAEAQRKSYDGMLARADAMDVSTAKLVNDHERVVAQIDKIKGGAGGDDPRVREVYGAMADAGISFPPGMRSVKAQNETIQGLLAAHPDDSATQIAARVRAGELSTKAAGTEANVVARREGQAAPAIEALNMPGGLYDQLAETAKKVNMGSAKIANGMRLKAQGEVIADPDISEYVNALTDTRAEFASVLARGGQVTDSVRIASEHAFPEKSSLAELQRNIARSKKIAKSIQDGNSRVLKAIEEGKDIEDIDKAAVATAAAPKAPAPYDDAAKEQRYQEWKRAHPTT
jgi:hypothetical protein